MPNYRNAFVFALAGNLVLIGILAAFWWRSSQRKKAEAVMQAAASVMPETSSVGEENTAMAPHETTLVPVQLSPERPQSIGVRIGRVERKSVDDE